MKMKVKAYICYKHILTKRTCGGSMWDIIVRGSQFVQHVFEEVVGSDLTKTGKDKYAADGGIN